MQVVIEGNTVKAARITGPQHHFLEIEFCESPVEIMFYDRSNSRSNETEEHELFLKNIVDELQYVDSVSKISSVSYDVRDSLNKGAYRDLFLKILESCPVILN